VDVVIFLPVAFIGGLVGNIFREFSLVFVTAVLMSLLISFTITPLLSSRLNNKDTLEGEKWMRGFARRFEKWFVGLEQTYRTLLEWALEHRGRVILVTSALMIGSISLIPLGFIGSDFMPATDRGEFAVNTKMPLGTTLEENSIALAKIEDFIGRNPDLEQMLTVIGQQETELIKIRGSETFRSS
jgi:HAE1 family hydrophobic/amphiphilic exporter-1